MNENNQNYYEEESEINLLDLFINILKKWRLFIIGGLVCAIIGCGVSVYKMNTNNPEYVKAKLDKIQAKDSSAIDEDKIKQYNDYQALYDKQLEKESTSVVLTLDENNIYTGTLSYSIQASSRDIDIDISYLNQLLNRDNNWQNLLNYSGLDCSIDSFKELVSYSSYKISNGSIISEVDVSTNGNIYANFYYSNEEVVNKVLKWFAEAIESDCNHLQAKASEFKYTKLSDTIVFGYNSKVSDAKTSAVKYRQDLLTTITTLKGKLSDDEKLFYSYNYQYDKMLEEMEKNGFAKKPPVFGFAIGVVLIGMYVVCDYLLSNVLKSENECKDKHRLTILSSVDLRTKKLNKIDQWIEKMENNNFGDINYLKATIQSLNKKSLLVCSENEEINKVLNKTKGIKLVTNLDTDEEAIKNINNVDGIILVCEVNKSKNSRIQRAKEIARNFNKEIIGVITVR